MIPNRGDVQRLLLTLCLVAASTGCAELHQHAVGARIHRFTAAGQPYVHCSILFHADNPAQVHDLLEVCREEAMQQPSPLKK
jgi:hypothetical protein